MNLYIKTHALSDYGIKTNIKNLPSVAMFGGLAERLLKPLTLIEKSSKIRTFEYCSGYFDTRGKLFPIYFLTIL